MSGAGGQARSAAAVAVGLMVMSTVLPPEIHPWSGAVCRVAAAVAALWLIGGPGSPSLSCLAALLPFAAASILSAGNRAAAIDEASAVFLLLVAGIAGRGAGRLPGTRSALVRAAAALGTAAAGQAALQHHFLWPAQAGLARVGSGGAAAVLSFLEAGRPIGPFILPAALGGFLAMTLPLTLAAAFRARSIAARSALLVAIAVQLHALALTRSFGALLALAAGLLLGIRSMAAVRLAAARRRLAFAVLAAAMIAAGWFAISRNLEKAASEGIDPLTLRLGNWRVAASMVADHPLFGVGPGSFATYYSRYIRPGMNEARHAHNSYLEWAAGWGFWALLPIGMLIAACLRASRPGEPRTGAPADRIEAASLAAAAGSFLVHNLGDFTAFLPGVAVSGAALVGAAIGSADGDPADAPVRAAPAARPVRRSAWIAACLVPLCALYAGQALTAARVRLRVEAARAVAEAGDPARGLRLARDAARLGPEDAVPQALLAQLVLAHFRDDPSLMKEGAAAASRAVRLDPESAILHYTRALYHEASGEMAPAFRERQEAHRLYPLKALYAPLPSAAETGR